MELVKVKKYSIFYVGLDTYELRGTEDIYINPEYIIMIQKDTQRIKNFTDELYNITIDKGGVVSIDKQDAQRITNIYSGETFYEKE